MASDFIEWFVAHHQYIILVSSFWDTFVDSVCGFHKCLRWSSIAVQLTISTSANSLAGVTTCASREQVNLSHQRGDEEEMKTSRAVGAVLGVLALPIIRQLYHQTVNVNSSIFGTARDVTPTTSKNKKVQNKWSHDTNTGERGIEAQFEQYSFDEDCHCQRTAPNLSQLERHFNPSTVEQARRSSEPWKPAYGSYVGNSTCNRHSDVNYKTPFRYDPSWLLGVK